MNRTFSIVMVVIGAGIAPTAMAQIQNGSFEFGLPYAGGMSIYTPGTPTPWTATSYTPDLYDNTGVTGWGLGGIPAYNNMFQGMAACAGNRFIGFAASTSFNGINEAFSQTTPALTPGQTYVMSACLAVDDLGKAIPFGGPYAGRGQVNVLLNGNLIGTFTQNTASLTWESRSFSFVAPNASTAVFEFVAQLDPTPGAIQSSYMGLDDIRLSVPAPASAGLVGMLGTLTLRRRRRAGSAINGESFAMGS